MQPRAKEKGGDQDEATNRSPLHTLGGDTDEVSAVALIRGGKLRVKGGKDGTVWL